MNTPVKSTWIVDDDLDSQKLLAFFLKKKRFQTRTFGSAVQALEALERPGTEIPDLIFSDLMMETMDGIEFARRTKALAPRVPVIVITGHASIDTAVRSIRSGAFDYIVKPFNFAELELTIERALRLQGLELENDTLRKQLQKSYSLEDMIGKSRSMSELFATIRRISTTVANVLIQGESGTGKELVARAIHRQGTRASHPFLPINCAAIPDQLLESELFGHTRGSFTGANSDRAGLFDEADGGTVFLDEIGDMPLSLQVKLLRVLQDRKIKPVGANNYRPINVRIIAATHRDLPELVAEGKFREDLFYRLNVVPIRVSPLRERSEDLPILAEHFLEKYASLHQAAKKTLSQDALNRLLSHPWPGNVRELENVIERSLIFSQGDEIQLNEILLPELREGPGFDWQARGSGLTRLLSLAEIESRYIQHVLLTTDGRKDQAARILGIDPKTLYRRIKDST